MISDGVAEPRSPVERNHLYSCFKCVRTLRCKAWALVWNYTCPPTNIHISVTINPVTPLTTDQRLSILYLFQRRVSEFIINPATRYITCSEKLKMSIYYFGWGTILTFFCNNVIVLRICLKFLTRLLEQFSASCWYYFV